MPTLFPNALDTTVNLPNIEDVVAPTTLTSPVGLTDNVINVVSTSDYSSSNGLIIIDSEQITYASTSNTQFIDCYRGFGGTPVTSHNVNTTVYSSVTAIAYTNLRDAILQIEQFIGIAGSNIAITDKSNSFTGSQNLANGLILNTPADTGLDEWSIAPTNNGTTAILNFMYQGGASSSSINIPGVVTPHSIAFINTYNSASNLVIDSSISPNVVVQMTSDVSSASFINAIAGQIYVIQISQDSVGGHIFSFPPNFKSPPILPTTSNTRITLLYFYDGTYAWPIGQLSS